MSKPIAGRTWRSNADKAADEQRRILDAFHSRQATRYLELLKTLPPEQQPKSGPQLVGDYLEFLTTP
jgi:hypothetical protein